LSASSITTMRMTNGQARQIAGSAGDVKDRADLPSLEARDQPAGLFCRDSDKVNASRAASATTSGMIGNES